MSFVEFQKKHKSDLGLTAAAVATTTTTGAFWSVGDAHHAAFIFIVGTVTATTTISVVQALNNAGGSAKAISGKSIALGTGDSNSIQILEVEASELDVAGAFNHVAVKAVAAGAGAILGATVVRYPTRYKPL